MAFVLPQADLPPYYPPQEVPNQQPGEPGDGIPDPRYIKRDEIGTITLNQEGVAAVYNLARVHFSDANIQNMTQEWAYNFLDEYMPASVDRDELQTIASGLVEGDLESRIGMTKDEYIELLLRAQLICSSFDNGEAGVYGVQRWIVNEGRLIQIVEPVGVACIEKEENPEGRFTTYHVVANNVASLQIGMLAGGNPSPASEMAEMVRRTGGDLNVPVYLEGVNAKVRLAVRDLDGNRSLARPFQYDLLKQAGIPISEEEDSVRFSKVVEELVSNADSICDLAPEIREAESPVRRSLGIETFSAEVGGRMRDYVICVYSTDPSYSSWNDLNTHKFRQIVGGALNDNESVFVELEDGIYLRDDDQKILGNGVSPVVFEITDWEAVINQIENESGSRVPIEQIFGGITALLGIAGVTYLSYKYVQRGKDTFLDKRLKEGYADWQEIMESYGEGRNKLNYSAITYDLVRMLPHIEVSGEGRIPTLNIDELFRVHKLAHFLRSNPKARRELMEHVKDQYSKADERLGLEESLGKLINSGTKDLDSKGGLIVNAMKASLSSDSVKNLREQSNIPDSILDAVEAEIRASQMIKVPGAKKSEVDMDALIASAMEDLDFIGYRANIPESIFNEAARTRVDFDLERIKSQKSMFTIKAAEKLREEIEIMGKSFLIDGIEQHVFNLGSNYVLNIAIIRYEDLEGNLQNRTLSIISRKD